MKNEIEATFLSIDKDLMRNRLKSAGFILKHPEYMMRRKTFDFSYVEPGVNKWGRVRQEADRTTMTIKRVNGKGISDTYETELIVDSFENATSFFEACNIPEKSSQENLREMWIRDDVEVSIDTWPGLKPFVEIEGVNDEVVKNVAGELGFKFENAVFGSIDLIYEKEIGIPSTTIIHLQEITFTNPPSLKED